MNDILPFIVLGLIILGIYYNKQEKIKKEKLNQEEVKKKQEELKKKREENHIKKVAERKELFNKTKLAMDEVNCNKSNIIFKKRNLKDMPLYQFSKITKKSSKDLFRNFIVLDVETTGLSAKNDEILEICAIKFKDYAPIEYMSTLVKPKKEIAEEITKINSITNEMIENSPTISEIIDSFSEFIKGYNIVGYNLEFDLKFLYVNNLEIFEEKRKFFDVLELARKVIKYDYIADYKLKTVCDYLDLYRDDEHRAISDALATGILFRDLSIELTESYEIKETSNFINE